MKKLIWIILIIVLFDCNNPAKEASPKADYKIEVASDEDVAEESFVSAMARPAPVSNSYLELSEYKLKELFESIYLDRKHSEFKISSDSTSLQLFDFISSFELTDRPEINNVKLIGTPNVINDSIDKIVLSYDLKLNSTVLTDTISAMITKRIIEIDEQSLIDMQLEFKKEN